MALSLLRLRREIRMPHSADVMNTTLFSLAQVEKRWRGSSLASRHLVLWVCGELSMKVMSPLAAVLDDVLRRT